MRFTKPKKAIGIDIGTHSVKAVQMSRARGRLHVDAVGYALVDRNQVNVDPVAAHAEAVREAVRHMQVNQCLAVGAVPGQTAVIRYPRLPDMPYEQVSGAIEAEAGQNIPYDLSEVYLDSYPLETVTEGDERMLRVLLVAAKHDVILSRVDIARGADLEYGVLTVDSLALADAAECCEFLHEGESVALVDIGLTSASIHFTKDGVSNFIRDVSWGAREFIQSIAKVHRCDFEEAEKMLQTIGEEQSREAPAEPSFGEEMGLEGEDLGSLETPILSSIESPLDPLADEFGEGDTVAGAGAHGAGAGPPEKDIREVLRMSLSRLVSEIRRSFDYYEHQLYERPVDRLLLCGGVAHLPLLGQSLTEELGIDRVEVADPSNSALLFGDSAATSLLRERPAQYMVAVGLAARGMADL